MGYDLNQARKRKDDPAPASRAPAEEPYDPVSETIQIALRRGLDPKEVLAERRRVLRSRG